MTTTENGPPTAAALDLMDAWWRAANYLSVGQIYLRRPLPALQALRERHRAGQAAAGAVAVHGRGGNPLHARRRDLGVGVVRG
jgi:phosphoketolase